MYSPAQVKLTNSASAQNLFSTYVCLVNDIKPDFDKTGNREKSKISLHITEPMDVSPEPERDEETIKVERTKAFHELKEKDVENSRVNAVPTTVNEESEIDDNIFVPCENSHILQLTRMKWLTEGHNGLADASSPSLSPVVSTTSSFCSVDSDDEYNRNMDEDRHLSTILRLDREHNLFGLSNIAIVGAKQSKKSRKENEKPVFPQTAIVQVCCGTRCCKHKSNTELPCSLKCGSAKSCCVDPCNGCGSCGFFSCTKELCGNCLGAGCSLCCPTTCTEKCCMECDNCCGLRIKVSKKPVYEPSLCELTPRASSELSKPFAARICTHSPKCEPPSPWFPYLMPCFWPARASAPCNNPAYCFHKPPCPPPRSLRSCPVVEKCPHKCNEDKKKCTNKLCLGRNPETKQAFEQRFGKCQ